MVAPATTHWIDPNNTGGLPSVDDPVGLYVYEVYFAVPSGIQSIIVNFRFAADNDINIFLNGTPIPGTNFTNAFGPLMKGPVTQTLTNPPPGMYTLRAEVINQPPFGPNPTGLLVEGTVKCEPAQGTVIVKKVMVGGTDTFNYTGTPNGSISTNNGTIQANVVPGTYTSTEAVPTTGWSLISIVCDDTDSTGNVGTRTATFNVAAGETVTCTFTNTKKEEPKFEICGIKWNDLNGNSKQDLGEPGLPNWTINLVFGTPPNQIDLQAITDASGRYCFTGLAAGTYTVSETLLSGWVQTFPQNPATHTVTLPPSKTDVNFGNQKKEGKAEICVFKFEDKDGDGKKGPNEPLLAGWTFNVNPGPPNQVTTGPQGGICFGVSAPGTVTITEVVQSGWTPTTQTSQTVTVQPGQLVNVFFGNQKKEGKAEAVICVTKFNDLNGNGKQDPGELGLSNWIFTVQPGNLTGTTNSKGEICFTVPAPGTYIVTEQVQFGWILTTPNPQTANVSPGQQVNLSFGNQKKDGKAEICVFKFEDKDGDGKKGPNEPLLAGWTFNVNPGPPNQVTTGPQGGICFGVSAPGTVTITEVVQSGWTPTTQTSQTVTVQPGQLVNVFFGNRKREEGRCDLAISKAVKGGRLISGQQGAYVVTIINRGNGNCNPVIAVTDTLGPGLVFVSAGGPPGVVCGGAGQTVTCTRNSALGPGQSFQIQINVMVRIDPGKQAGNCAAVKNPNDVNLANNEVCITTVVQKS